MFNFFKKKQKKPQVLLDTESSSNSSSRAVNIPNDSCAIIISSSGQYDVVLTTNYDEKTQEITANEELVMSLAVLLKHKRPC